MYWYRKEDGGRGGRRRRERYDAGVERSAERKATATRRAIILPPDELRIFIE